MGVHNLNPCAAAFNINDEYGAVQGNRKAIILEMFLTYGIYVALITIGAKNQNYPAPKGESQSGQGDNDGQDPDRKNRNQDGVLSINYAQLERFFYPFFSYHLVLAGAAVYYEPYAFAVVISYLHFVCYIAILVLTRQRKDPKYIKYLYIVCQLFNIMLLLNGLAGIGKQKRGTKEEYDFCVGAQIYGD